MATKLAQALGISLDYLIGSTDQELDADVLKTIMDIQKLSEEDKKGIMYAIQGLLRDAKARSAYS